ncbi:hypothetical protein BV898_11576 [Hypsibius exemplaris]|uniref:Uncharacterized protein n=1 Tax=Hypsibius exemplaris TaxID=2072580 RepID=A0A1W0WG98_HYPEX|nr:hypothetical protein BV898_11576 [Hypsibius exemplaris]
MKRSSAIFENSGGGHQSRHINRGFDNGAGDAKRICTFPNNLGGIPSSGGATLTFDNLVKCLTSGQLQIPPVWKKIVDAKSRTILLCQVEFLQGPPRFSKCLRIQWEKPFLPSSKPIPALFRDQKEVSEQAVESLLGRNFIHEARDVLRLVNFLTDSSSAKVDVPAELVVSGCEELPQVSGNYGKTADVVSSSALSGESDGEETDVEDEVPEKRTLRVKTPKKTAATAESSAKFDCHDMTGNDAEESQPDDSDCDPYYESAGDRPDNSDEEAPLGLKSMDKPVGTKQKDRSVTRSMWGTSPESSSSASSSLKSKSPSRRKVDTGNGRQYRFGESRPDGEYRFGERRPDGEYRFGESRPNGEYRFGESKPDGEYRFGPGLFVDRCLERAIDLDSCYWSRPGPDQLPIIAGRDDCGVYLYKDALDGMREASAGISRRTSETGKAAATDADFYAWTVVLHLMGGIEGIQETRRKGRSGLGLAGLLGRDIIGLIMAHTTEVFRDTGIVLDPIYFKKFCSYKTRLACIPVCDTVGQSGSLLASVLFNETTLMNPDAVEDVDCAYSTTPSPYRTSLSKKHSIFVNTFKLAELQRYFGPESVSKSGGSVEYAWKLLWLLFGGYEKFLQLVIAKRKSPNLYGFFGKDVVDAVYAHIVSVYSADRAKFRNLEKLQNYLLTRTHVIIKNYDENVGPTMWRLRGEQMPPAIASLEGKKYWREPAPDRTQLRPGHKIFITTSVLDNIRSNFGPGSSQESQKKFGWELIKHMLDLEVMKQCRDLKLFPRSVTSFLGDDVVLALCLYIDEQFHLLESLHPNILMRHCIMLLAECRRPARKRGKKYGKL